MSKTETAFYVVVASSLVASWYNGIQFSAGLVLCWVIAAWISSFMLSRLQKKVVELLHAIAEAREITIKQGERTVNVLRPDGRRETREDP